MFSIIDIPFGSLTKIRLFNDQTKELLSIIPGFGGNINELVLEKNGKTFTVILSDPDEASLKANGGTKFYGSRLSPFPNRIKDGTYTFEEKIYKLPRNEKDINALHGLLWNKPFDVKQTYAGESSAFVILSYTYDGSEPGYPFPFITEIKYELSLHEFKCTTAVKNISKDNMPLADGWHPYIHTGSSINDLVLKLPAARMILTDDNLIPTGKTEDKDEFYEGAQLNDTFFDNCFGPIETEGIAETTLTDKAQDIKITVWQKAGFRGYNYVQVYTPPDRKSIVIEPMSCEPNAFVTGEGLIVLKPEQVTEFEFGIRLM